MYVYDLEVLDIPYSIASAYTNTPFQVDHCSCTNR